MSDAKWCDGCGAIFPAGIEGSESGVGRITRNDSVYGTRTIDQVRDWCPECVSMRTNAHNTFSPARILREIEKTKD